MLTTVVRGVYIRRTTDRCTRSDEGKQTRRGCNVPTIRHHSTHSRLAGDCLIVERDLGHVTSAVSHFGRGKPIT